MMHTFLKKLVRLGQGEDGAALVVTLALFMFMYLSCAGVFAIGQTAKNRIHLQNACDAAAYSAAVVQADTLSRIATINRAMAWTYVSMTKRQMDYIVWKWLDHTKKHCDEDAGEAWKKGCQGIGCGIHPVWYLGPTAPSVPLLPTPPYFLPEIVPTELFNPGIVSLNKHTSLSDLPTVTEIGTHLLKFTGGHFLDESFYNQRGRNIGILKDQISADKTTIESMGKAIDNLLSPDGLPKKVEKAVDDILVANIPGEWAKRCYWKVIQSESPKAQYTRVLKGNEELRFLDFANYQYDNTSKPFATGSAESEWFPLYDKNKEGIQRRYDQKKNALVSKWYVAAWNWKCEPPYIHIPEKVSVQCQHFTCDGHHTSYGCDKDREELEAQHLWEDAYYVGQRAEPRVLTMDYFKEEGTITVGLACYNENPWYGIFQNSAGVGKGILSGIFAAFNPYKDVEWSWAFSSAKAGYKFKNEDLDRRDYMIDWKEKESNQSWNLCQSDWDAVFVPVRRAVSKAEDGEWTDRKVPPLDDWIKNGDWQPLKNSGGAYVVSNMPRLPGMNGSGSGINWKRVADMLYH